MNTQQPYTVGQPIPAIYRDRAGTVLGPCTVTAVTQRPDGRWKIDYQGDNPAEGYDGKCGDIVTATGRSDYISTPAAGHRTKRQRKAGSQLLARIATEEGIDLTFSREINGWRVSEWLGEVGQIERGFLYPTRSEALADLKLLTRRYKPRPLGRDAHQGVDLQTHYREFTWQSLLDSLKEN